MRIVEILALENGAHRNQTVFGEITPPDGWVVIPDDMVCENFPFGEVAAEEIDGVTTATSWTPGAMPEPEPAPEPEPEPPTDLEARVAALEADAEQAALDRAALTLLLTGEDTEATT